MSMMDDYDDEYITNVPTITNQSQNPLLVSQQYYTATWASTSISSTDAVDNRIKIDPERIANIEELREAVLKKVVNDPRLDEDYKIVLSYLREHLEKLMDSPDNLLTHLIEDNKDLRKRIEILEEKIRSLEK